MIRDDPLHTVVETEIYLRSTERVMSVAEREAVTDYVAAHPQAGDVIPAAAAVCSRST